MTPPGGSSPWTPWDETPEPTAAPAIPDLAPARVIAPRVVEPIPVSLPTPPDPAVPLRARVAPIPDPPVAPVDPDATAHSVAVVPLETSSGGGRRGRFWRRHSPRHAPRKKRSRRFIVGEWIGVLLIAVLLAVGLRSFAFQAFYVPSTSMEPTLQPGDRILVDKFDFHASSLSEGNIVVFKTPAAARTRCATTDPDLVKRVIGLPGDKIYSVNNTIYIDDKALKEPYLPSGTTLGPEIGSLGTPVVVPRDDYYVLGDNRSVSCDSRYFGFVAANAIVGKVIAVIWRHNHPVLDRF